MDKNVNPDLDGVVDDTTLGIPGLLTTLLATLSQRGVNRYSDLAGFAAAYDGVPISAGGVAQVDEDPGALYVRDLASGLPQRHLPAIEVGYAQALITLPVKGSDTPTISAATTLTFDPGTFSGENGLFAFPHRHVALDYEGEMTQLTRIEVVRGSLTRSSVQIQVQVYPGLESAASRTYCVLAVRFPWLDLTLTA